ncbi:MAG: DoxX family membrane protein, partial [Rhizobiales bacterium]|nr:DoxX family membrane protein [Hyphomicrobiales bacterium]
GDMKKMGVHFPRLTLAAGTTFQITAGALLMFGLFVVPAALGLTIFTIAASVMMLPFWSMEGTPRIVAFNNWLSNIGIIGGLLIAAAHPLS